MGGRDRAQTHPWIPLALAGKVAFDAVNAGKLTIDQPVKFRAFCAFCVVASLATFATVPLVWPETREAVQALTGRPKPAKKIASRLRNLIDV